MVTVCKVHHDGSHFVATPYIPSRKKTVMRDTSKTEKDLFFDTSFELSSEQGLRSEEQRQFIINQFVEKYGYDEQLSTFVKERYTKKMKAIHERLKRFYRIVYLNKWSHFVTFTYDDKKHTAESFETQLKKTFSNFNVRHGWKCVGVFEKSPEEERKHFHGLFYIPYMVGNIEEVQDYSFKTHNVQITHINDYFLKRFGRNDFDEISQEELKYGNTLNYITKYILKQNQKIYYSRGLNSPNYHIIIDDFVTAEINEYGQQFVLWDTFNPQDKTFTFADTDLKYPSYFSKDVEEMLKARDEFLKFREENKEKDYSAGLAKWYQLRFGEDLK